MHLVFFTLSLSDAHCFTTWLQFILPDDFGPQGPHETVCSAINSEIHIFMYFQLLEGAEFVKHGIIEKQISEEGRPTAQWLVFILLQWHFEPKHRYKKHLTQTHSKHKDTNTLLYILPFCIFNLSRSLRWISIAFRASKAFPLTLIIVFFSFSKLTYHEWQQGALKMNSFLWSWWLVEPAANNWFRAGARGTSNTLISFTFLIFIFAFTYFMHLYLRNWIVWPFSA